MCAGVGLKKGGGMDQKDLEFSEIGYMGSPEMGQQLLN